MKQRTVDEIVRDFGEFLNASWAHVTRVLSDDHSIQNNALADWMQANWELLVEHPLRSLRNDFSLYLEIYGDGADCNGESSRVWLPDAAPTHRVVCRSRSSGLLDDAITTPFDRFVAKTDGGWRKDTPPYDSVVVLGDTGELHLGLESIVFELEMIS